MTTQIYRVSNIDLQLLKIWIPFLGLYFLRPKLKSKGGNSYQGQIAKANFSKVCFFFLHLLIYCRATTKQD